MDFQFIAALKKCRLNSWWQIPLNDCYLV